MSHLLLTAVFVLIISSPVGFSQNQPSKPSQQSVQDSLPSAEKFLPPDYEVLLDKGMNYQFRADSLMKVADLYRRQLQDNLTANKSELRTIISETERLAAVNQKLATGILGAGTQKQKDSVNRVAAKQKTEKVQQKPLELFSIFEVIPKPVYTARDKIPVNPEVPAGLIYRIQIAVFKNPAAPSYFKGISPVYGFKSEGPGVTIYYAGMFRKMSDATKALAKVKASGFKDSFVVALLDKKIVSADRAGILEKEWGNKPLIIGDISQIQSSPLDTIPPTLVFRVEVTRSPKPLTAEKLELIRRLAGNRGLEIIKNASGQNIYLIGKFLTFEDAAEYADLLTRNGQKDAKVAAYLGRREIPVETAKQLFEKY
jgi:hypothetical protein